MKHIVGVLMVAAGLALVGLGLLFLIAAGSQPHRYLVGAAGLGLGAALTGFGVRTFRRARALEPAALRATLLALARRHDGRVSTADLTAALGARLEPARPVLEDLVRDGVCARESEDRTVWYVFPDLLPRLAVRRCQHCKSALPLTAEAHRCPSCGGDLRVGVERVALGDGEEAGLYSMDE